MRPGSAGAIGAPPGCATHPQPLRITERQITVPHTVTRVASAREAQTFVVAMLGVADNIVATTRAAKGGPAFGIIGHIWSGRGQRGTCGILSCLSITTCVFKKSTTDR